MASASFFDLQDARSAFCQGDVLQIQCDLPVIDAEGQPAVVDRQDDRLWLLIGNTCDFDRSVDKLKWTHLVPLDCIGTDATLDSGELDDLKSYRSSRYFYVPSWHGNLDDRHYLAQFSQIVTVHKEAVLQSSLVARLSHIAWFLLNACTVRFLARADRRFIQ